jgi:hypothetical protein
LVLTFSRTGLVGSMVGSLVCFAVAGWSALISRRVLTLGAVILTLVVALSPPLLLVYFETRPESYNMRFYLLWAALRGYLQHPILGVGLNNGTAAMKEGRVLWDSGIKVSMAEPIENHYLAVLTEAGPVGFILFFVFFGKVVTIALRALREVAIEVKPLLVGLVGGLASVATQSLADDPLGGHAISAFLWLFAGLIIAIARHHLSGLRVVRDNAGDVR